MKTLAIEGMQWGDEGKGKVTDFCASHADIVVRSQGGNNAGHSIEHHGVRYALRLLPSGILNPDTVNVIADGVVINPKAMLEELRILSEKGISSYQLLISKRATLLMPYHIEIDKAREEALGDKKIGTTKNGIGPCYEDRASRLSLRVGDLLDIESLQERVESILPLKNLELKAYGGKEFSVEEIMAMLLEVREALLPHIIDTTAYLQKALKEGKKILFEGAQGAMLCMTYGTFPFVTSSSPLATAIPNNTGLPLTAVEDVLGIMKAYTTRVGAGPFPTEIDGPLADSIREKGHEFGTVTHRPRRVGWLDLPQLKYVIEISGIKRVALMLLDVLSAVDELKLCTGYFIDGKEIDYMPSTVAELEKVEPQFITMPSWKEDISSIRNYDELPLNCRRYLETIEEKLGVKIAMVSVGPDKEATILREELF
ncbi:MAG: adenylosuccinate synthase [Candidatus Enterosoma sp.]|nr:adenylosuccinate synthase [Bacilli bacterium]MDD6845923.1 adenylosuccinate synthase [bacterium]MDY2571921.1 adenylosuccinate synthase [Candidatus Enterosoma sp.]MCI6608154.1 adenylosuccinate synthase [Bacilli bacterium]MDD7081459.1 adenylosuccinate synthase [bacterium]